MKIWGSSVETRKAQKEVTNAEFSPADKMTKRSDRVTQHAKQAWCHSYIKEIKTTAC